MFWVYLRPEDDDDDEEEFVDVGDLGGAAADDSSMLRPLDDDAAVSLGVDVFILATENVSAAVIVAV